MVQRDRAGLLSSPCPRVRATVLEECDGPDEWFYDSDQRLLYFNFNGTGGPTGNEEWVATKARVVFNISGTQAAPVDNVTLQGLVIRDSRYTYLDPHGLPSGGDWGLQHTGAVTVEGSRQVRAV